MRKRSSDSSKSNSTTITTPGSSHLDYPPANSGMRMPVAWQHREQNISRPVSSHRKPLQPTQNKLLYKQHQSNQRLACSHDQQLVQNQKHQEPSNQLFQNVTQQSHNQLDCRPLKSLKAINKQCHHLVNKQRVQKHSHPKKILLRNKHINLRHSSSPSLETTSSDEREEAPIVRHSRRNITSRASNKLSTDQRSVISQLTRNSQLMTVPTGVISHNDNIIYYPTAAVYRNATLRSTRSVPGIVMQQKIIKQHHQKLPRQMAYTTSTYEVDQCPVHGSTVLNSMPNQETTSLNIFHSHHQNQILRKFASVNDLPKTNLSHNFTSAFTNGNNCSQLKTTVIPVFNRTILNNNQPTFAINPIKNLITKPTGKLFTTNCSLPLPLHPATVATAICAQPIHLNNNQHLIVPTFTNDAQTVLNNKYSDKIVSYLNAQTMLQRDACCSGYLIVLWIILGVVIVGVISGIVLAVTIN